MAGDRKIYRTIGGVIGKMELKTLGSGKKVLQFGIGVNINPEVDQSTWVNAKAWEMAAEEIEKICDKGDKILVNGPMDEYQGKWSITVYDWAYIKKRF